MAEEFLRRHGLERRITLIVPGFSAAAMTAATTDWAAGMPKRVAEELAKGLPLRVLRLPTPQMSMPLSLVWHPRTHDDPGAIAFRTLLFDNLRKPPKNDRSVRRTRGRTQ
jgi:DNA-binding transcriptional LysR family regulator